MNAGKTKVTTGTKIKTTVKWWGGNIITGTITHPFGCFGGNAIAGIYIDKPYQDVFGEIGNLYRGDFKVIEVTK